MIHRVAVLEKTPHRLVLAEPPLLTQLRTKAIVGIGFTLALAGGLGAYTASLSSTGSLTTLTCQGTAASLDCRLQEVNVQGQSVQYQKIVGVRATTLTAIPKTRLSCSGSKEDRDCKTIRYNLCQVNLVTAIGEWPIPLPEFQTTTADTDTPCPSQTPITAQFADWLANPSLGVAKTWEADTRLGEVGAVFQQQLLPWLVLGGVVATNLWVLASSQRTWTFDKARRRAACQQKRWWSCTEETWDTETLTGIDQRAVGKFLELGLWQRGPRTLRTKFLVLFPKVDVWSLGTLRPLVEPFLSTTHRIGTWQGWDWEQEDDIFRLYDPSGKLHLTCDRRAGSLTYQDHSIAVADIQALRRQITTDEEGDNQETLWLDTAARSWELTSIPYSSYEMLATNLGEALGVPVVTG